MNNNTLKEYFSLIGEKGGKKILKKYGNKHFIELSKKAAEKRKKKKPSVDN